VSVQRRETKTGTRWDVRLRDPSGRVYNRTFATKREAQAYERSERTARDRGDWVDPHAGRQTVGEWVDYWWTLHAPNLAPKTRAQYESTLNRWVLPALGTRRLSSLTPLDLQELVNDWARTAKPSTVHLRFAVLRTALLAAVTGEVLGRSPCRGIRLPKREQRRRSLPDIADLERLAAAMGTNYSAMVWLGALLGMRWGEVAGLRVGAVDLLRRQLIVGETVGEAKGVLHIGAPKTAAGRRLLPLPAVVCDVLAEHMRAEGLTGANGDEWVFRSPRGGPLRYSMWHLRVWIPAREAIGSPALGFHDLRRFYASQLVEAGVDVKVSQELMGHEDIRLTRGLYAQAGDDLKQRANDAIAAQLLGDRQREAETGEISGRG